MNPTPPPFEILEILGEGAFGTVCVGRLRSDPLRRIVAIKIIKAEYATNTKIINRTRDEARLLSKLQHPNIVRVEQLIEVQGRPIVVMEYVRGLDLKHLVRRHAHGLPATVAFEVMRRTCLALHAAYHDAVDDNGQPLRVIHRDIKSSNLLLSVHGQIKVVDFGIATGQFGERESFTESLVMGSRAYMAPERLDGRPDTPAVDVYGAGMCLYELLTGRVMGLSVNPSAHDRTLVRHLDLMEIKGLDERGHHDLRRLMQRMCVYDAELRPTAADAAAELEHIAALVDPAERIGLEDFGRTVVQKQYDERKRPPLRKVLEESDDADFLLSATLPSTPGLDGPTSPSTPLRNRPAAFIGALAGSILILGALNVRHAMQRSAEPAPVATDRVHVNFWFPSDASIRVGSLSLSVPGALEIPPGPQEADVVFRDGNSLVCPFEAAAGHTVRLVFDRGTPALTVNDGPIQSCKSLPPSDSP